jgi:thiamine pyrophosphate-dependent acetolactate synthase large subunit-like protein
MANDARVKRNSKMMNRLDLTTRLVSKLKNDEAVIGGIGNSNFDLFNAGRRPQNFYMLGSMGLAAPIALGVALAQPKRRVFALEGDGSLLMQLGCLATIANIAPKNLTVVVWDNALYQITGSQKTATAGKADLVEIARGAGIAQSAWANDEADFERLIEASLAGDGPGFIAARIDGTAPKGQTPREPVAIKDSFMRGMGSKPA